MAQHLVLRLSPRGFGLERQGAHIARRLNSPRSNLRTVAYLTEVMEVEGFDLQAQRRNPTGQGIHKELVLTPIDGK